MVFQRGARQPRLLARYRLMFRASTMAFGAALLLSALGVLAIIYTADMRLLAGGMLLAAMSGILAYKVAVSTMHLIEAEVGDQGWRDAPY